MKKKIFLLLPEIRADMDQCVYFPKTRHFNPKQPNDYILMNVYEYFRSFHSKKTATELSLNMLSGFDELWYYGAFDSR